MSENDPEDIVGGTIDEVKDRIRDMESPDYEALLEAEREGKDRKTVVDFLENRLDSGDESESEEMEELEEIEEATEGGLLGGYSGSSVFAGGLLLGLLVGLVAMGVVSGPVGASASPAEVKASVSGLFTATGGPAPAIEVSQQNGMFLVNVTMETTGVNGTRTVTQQYYVSPDGDMLFLTSGSLGRSTVYNIEKLKQQVAAQPDSTNQTGNATSQ